MIPLHMSRKLTEVPKCLECATFADIAAIFQKIKECPLCFLVLKINIALVVKQIVVSLQAPELVQFSDEHYL